MEADQYLIKATGSKVSETPEETQKGDLILAELKTVELEIIELLEKNYESNQDWSVYTDNFQRLTYLNCRHVAGNYLRKKYKGTPQELQEFITGDTNWDDPTFKTLIESMSKRTKPTQSGELATLEAKIEKIKTSTINVEEMKQLCKHYLKKDMKPILAEVKALTEKCNNFEQKIQTTFKEEMLKI